MQQQLIWKFVSMDMTLMFQGLMWP